MEKPKSVSDLPGEWRRTHKEISDLQHDLGGEFSECADQLSAAIKNGPEVLVSAEDMDKLKKEMSPDWWFLKKYT